MRNRTENQIELWLIRHGETKSNEEHRYLGIRDEELSETGRQNLQQKANKYNLHLINDIRTEKTKDSGVEFVFSSPMKRCLESAGILFRAEKGNDFSESCYGDRGRDIQPSARELTIIPEWREMDFGDFEGKNYQELSGNPDYQAWIDSNGTLPFPNGESREEFAARSIRGFYRMMGMIKEENPYLVAAVVHGGTIMALLSSLYGGDYFDFQVPNGEGYSCIVDKEEPYRILNVEKL